MDAKTESLTRRELDMMARIGMGAVPTSSIVLKPGDKVLLGGLVKKGLVTTWETAPTFRSGCLTEAGKAALDS